MRYMPWSSLKIFRYIRSRVGIRDIQAASIRGWDAWEKQSKEKARFIFWLTYTLPNRLQGIVDIPADYYSNVKFYIKNRYFDKLHYLHTGLKPGEYYDLDTRILHGLFQSLVDFVEIEKAASAASKCSVKQKRNKDAGIGYLVRETGINDHRTNIQSKQAKIAIEILNLYHWWTKARPARPDPGNASGIDEFIKKHTQNNSNLDDVLHQDPALYTEYTAILNKISDIEDQYVQEDNEMCHRLIKIRPELWS